MNDDLRFPIGQPERHQHLSPEQRLPLIETVAQLPMRLGVAIGGLTAAQLDTPYRPGGWTVRQVVHHFADSHMNGYVRFRLALTEDEPTIKPYDQTKWAELKDAASEPIEVSLQLIDALHRRWVVLLNSMSDADFARRLRHPELGTVRLDTYLASYGWHCRHHAAHIHNLRQRMGWN